jgi:hypothetical protein
MENFHDMNSRMETLHQFQRLFMLAPKTRFYKSPSHKQITKLRRTYDKVLQSRLRWFTGSGSDNLVAVTPAAIN